MRRDRMDLDYQEHKELWEALNARFNNGEISEDQYRRNLARLGFNATEIEEEVKQNKSIGW